MLAVCLVAALAGTPRLTAYPPAPHHLLHGIVRDAFGTPIAGIDAAIVLETAAGDRIYGEIIPGIEPGLNYRLEVPMDSGMTADRYRATALRPTVPFRIWVSVGSTTHLPMEMSGDYSHLGQPGKSTRLDLTLGEDANHDGLPDAWQQLINSDLSKVKPNEANGQGMTYLQAYYAGTYAYDSPKGFSLDIVGVTNGAPVLAFTAVQGRMYAVQTSTDLVTWTAVPFRVHADGPAAPLRANYLADQVRSLQIEVPLPESHGEIGCFRLVLVQ
jgi:hypothetical protein